MTREFQADSLECQSLSENGTVKSDSVTDDKMTLTYEQPNRKKGGWHVTNKTALWILVLVVGLVMGVALIVYFASRTNSCGEEFVNVENDRLFVECESQAKTKNKCISLPSHCTAPPTEVVPTQPPIIEDIFLPKTLRPYHYNLLMWPWIYARPGEEEEPNPETFHNYGEVEIFFECMEVTDVIFVHVLNLRINRTSLTLSTVTPETVMAPQWHSLENDEERQFLKIHLTDQLTEGHKYKLKISWSADIDDSLMGFYRSSYIMNGKVHWLAATQFQATQARKAFPCMDEPNLKASFNISLKRLQSYTTLSNMEIRETSSPDVQDSGTYVTDHYYETVEMPTYLLAFVFCQFANITDYTESGTRVTIWTRPDAIRQATYALSVAVRVLQYFQSYFAIKYPLQKQDMIALPDFSAGAMENWGLITYRETALLFEEGISTVYNRQRIAVVVSHELAHQWFGNLVTMEWWDDLWLNEGFASFVEYLGVDHVEPTWNMNEIFISDDLHRVLASDSFTTSHPISVPVKNPDQIREIFDSISYSKGASLIRMMSSFLGESTFTSGLTNYLNQHAYGNADHNDLWNALNTQAAKESRDPVNITDVMNTWILQMGYPVITISRDIHIPSTIYATQQYFRLDRHKPVSTKFHSEFGYKWVVPLTLVSRQDYNRWSPPPIHWMNKGDLTIKNSGISPNDWIVANVNQMGYYRVNYDVDNWIRLIDQLKRDFLTITTINRAQILDDSFNLGRASLLDTLIFLKATEYINQERSYIVWKAFFRSMVYIDTMLSSSSVYGNLSIYLSSKMIPLYKQIGWDNIQHHQTRFLQRSIISSLCKLNYEPCVNKSIAEFKSWKANSSSGPPSVPPELSSTVYCNGVKHGTFEDWNYVLQKYRDSNVASEKYDFLKALACTKENWILNHYLQLTRDHKIFRKQDTMAAITYISRNSIGRYIVWNHVRSNWAYFVQEWGSGFYVLQKMLLSITASFNQQISIQELDDFPVAGPVERTLTQVKESTAVNIQWMKENENKIGQWLAETI